jgi:hypothetical protein
MKRRTKKSYYQRFMAMTDAQRNAEVAQFDREFVPSKPLSAADRATLRRAGLKVGRPKVGQGAQRYSITMERGLAKRADAMARKKKLTRSELIARGLEVILKVG